jgi:hypothetical protein
MIVIVRVITSSKSNSGVSRCSRLSADLYWSSGQRVRFVMWLRCVERSDQKKYERYLLGFEQNNGSNNTERSKVNFRIGELNPGLVGASSSCDDWERQILATRPIRMAWLISIETNSMKALIHNLYISLNVVCKSWTNVSSLRGAHWQSWSKQEGVTIALARTTDFREVY